MRSRGRKTSFESFPLCAVWWTNNCALCAISYFLRTRRYSYMIYCFRLRDASGIAFSKKLSVLSYHHIGSYHYYCKKICIITAICTVNSRSSRSFFLFYFHKVVATYISMEVYHTQTHLERWNLKKKKRFFWTTTARAQLSEVILTSELWLKIIDDIEQMFFTMIINI